MLRPAEIAEGGAQRVAQHLATLAERRLDDPHEEPFVAIEPFDAVAAQTDNGALDLGRRIEDLLPYRKEVFDVVPRLQQHRKNAVLLRPRRTGDAGGDLALNHADAFRYQIAILQDLEEDLRRDVVGKVPDHPHPVGKERP